MTNKIQLQGRIFFRFEVEVVTGLHIGGSSVGLEIGALDSPVIRDPLTKRPYIPGSSLRGKMRSQLEKFLGLDQNKPIGQNVVIHMCADNQGHLLDTYEKTGNCQVCHLFGMPGEVEGAAPTLLLVRDILLSDDSAKALMDAQTDFAYTQLKTEVAIDRVTSHATPRTIERVPAGAKFSPAEIVLNLFSKNDFEFLDTLLNGLQLVEDDYLGGFGSRGSGKVKFANFSVSARSHREYATELFFPEKDKAFADLQSLRAELDKLSEWLKKSIPVE